MGAFFCSIGLMFAALVLLTSPEQWSRGMFIMMITAFASGFCYSRWIAKVHGFKKYDDLPLHTKKPATPKGSGPS